MVDSVQPRRHDQASDAAFPTERHAYVRVMEQDAEEEQDLPDGDGGWSRTDDNHLSGTKNHRNGNFAEVKAKSSGRVHLAIDVVDAVEAPEQRDAMRQEMPPVQGVIQGQNGAESAQRRGKR